MSRKNILNSTMVLLFLVLLPSFVAAQTEGYKDYTIGKGDTLWDISNKELQDSFLWPKVWKENPGIKDPDRIYPGQKLRIPLYLLQKEVVPEIKPVAKPVIKSEIPKEKPVEKRTEPVKRENLVNKYVLIASGYIADSVHSIGRITGSQTGATILSKGDYAYIETNDPFKKGDKFFITQVAEKVIHPITGRMIGYLIEVLGIAEVVNPDKIDTKIKITSSFSDIPIGSLLDNYYEIEPPLAPENPRKPDINAYIVATKQLHEVTGNWDIVYLDIGREKGLEVGDELAMTLKGKHRIINGVVQIISLRETTSTAIIRKGNIETTKGDGITGITQE